MPEIFRLHSTTPSDSPALHRMTRTYLCSSRCCGVKSRARRRDESQSTRHRADVAAVAPGYFVSAPGRGRRLCRCSVGGRDRISGPYVPAFPPVRRGKFLIGPHVHVSLERAHRDGIAELPPDAWDPRLEAADLVSGAAVAGRLVVEVAYEADLELLGQEPRKRHRFRHSAPRLSSISDAWGRLNVGTPFHHLSGNSHLHRSLDAGLITASS